MEFTNIQIKYMKSALRGFCYDANPSQWRGSEDDRLQLEKLVKLGMMYKPKNHSADKHGFYALTDKGKKLSRITPRSE